MSRCTPRSSVPAAVIAAVALLLPLAACGDDDDATATTTTGADETTTTRDTTTTTERSAGSAPNQVAAVLADGRLALLDAASGDLDQTLLEGIDVGDPAKNGITVGPDGDDVFVVRPAPDDGQRHEIVRVLTDGSETEVVAQGRAPAVSPDGTTLAYVAVEPTTEPGQPEPYLVLQDLATGEETELRRDQEPGYYFIVDLAWTADGEQLAFVVGEIKTGLQVVDADADSLDAAEDLGPEAREEGSSWTAVTAFDDERLAVVETCCDVPPEERWHVLAVHVDTRSVEGTLLPEERVEAARLDSDESTDHVLVVSDRSPEGGTLARWSPPHAVDDGGGDDLVELRDDVIVAAW